MEGKKFVAHIEWFVVVWQITATEAGRGARIILSLWVLRFQKQL
jgi:hypothetical protein